MQATDAKAFGEHVSTMFEALGGRPLTERAMLAWFGQLMEFPTRDVLTEVDDAVRRFNKPPSCADLWKSLNERRSARIQDESKARRATERREADDLFRGRSDFGAQQLGELRRMLATIGAKPSNDWAQRLMDRVAAGIDVPVASLEMARRSLHWAPEDVQAIVTGGRAALAAQRAREPIVERVPGEDD